MDYDPIIDEMPEEQYDELQGVASRRATTT